MLHIAHFFRGMGWGGGVFIKSELYIVHADLKRSIDTVHQCHYYSGAQSTLSFCHKEAASVFILSPIS